MARARRQRAAATPGRRGGGGAASCRDSSLAIAEEGEEGAPAAADAAPTSQYEQRCAWNYEIVNAFFTSPSKPAQQRRVQDCCFETRNAAKALDLD